MYCENCGIKLESQDRFCQNCGAKVEIIPVPKSIPSGSEKESIPRVNIPVRKNNRKKKVLAIVIASVTALLAVCVLAVVFLINRSFKVSFDIGYDCPGGSPEIQMIKKNEYASEPKIQVREGYLFLGWYERKGDARPFDFTQKINRNVRLTALWYDEKDTTDTDGDMLYDVLEQFFKTDINNQDTDGDGLGDGLEVRVLGLDPLSRDTDHNGIADPDEDCDGDRLTNIEETGYGTSPLFFDTDRDSVNDYDEIIVYHTDPLVPDSDGDGVNDGKERAIGSNPLNADTSFTTRKESGTVNTYVPVSIEVTAVTDAAGAGTLNISEISSGESTMFSEAGIGYLGSAFSITSDGALESAEITFNYDQSLGTLSDTFQPRIYWYDEENDALVEVEDQIVTEHSVTAKVNHFSIYTLRNMPIVNYILGKISRHEDNIPLTDSNDDGIPDYYAEKIDTGEILFNWSDVLVGIVTQEGDDDDDWDDDGLKNGEEITFETDSRGRVKIVAISNPADPDTDKDGIGDYAEVRQLGTDPNRFDFKSKGALDQLENDSKYYYSTFRAAAEDQVALFLDYDKYGQAKKCIVDYISSYSSEELLNSNAAAAKVKAIADETARFFGVAGNLISVTHDIMDMAEDASYIDELKDPYFETLQVREDAMYSGNPYSYDEKRSEAVLENFTMITLPERLKEAVEKLEDDDAYSKLDGFAELMSMANDAISMYEKTVRFQTFEFSKQIGDIKNGAEAISHDFSFDAGTVLTIVGDALDMAKSQAEIISTYSQIVANAEAFNMYIDLLAYIHENAIEEIDTSTLVGTFESIVQSFSMDYYIGAAARDIAWDILDENGIAFYLDLAKALKSDRDVKELGILIDIASNLHPVAKIIATFIKLYKYTGVIEQGQYTVYFTTMKYMSDGCKALVEDKIKYHDQTFSCSLDEYPFVQKYMTQLAQVRIIGTYYLGEYCASNSMASWLSPIANLIFNNKNMTAQDYRNFCKNSILDVYKQARRLDLPISDKLPYYWETSHDAQPDELEGVADLSDLPQSLNDFLVHFVAYDDVENGKEYDPSDCAGLSSTILEHLLFNVPCCDYSLYPGIKREEIIYSSSKKSFDDPKGWIDEGVNFGGMLYTYDLETVKWVAEHIFSVPEDDFNEMLRQGEEDRHFYASGDTIYYFTGGIGWDYFEANIIQAKIENDVYRIVYSIQKPYGTYGFIENAKDYYYGTYYAELRFDEIDGERYWALLKHSESIPEDLFTDDWSWAYYQFILRGDYWDMGQTYTLDSENDNNPIAFGLHDIDADGIPELLASSGGDYTAAMETFVYTYDSGEIRYLGSLMPYGLGCFEDPDYPGIVDSFAHTGSYLATYNYIRDGELIQEQIYLAEDQPNGGSQKEKSRTDDKKLYQMYMDGDYKEITLVNGSELRSSGKAWDGMLETLKQ